MTMNDKLIIYKMMYDSVEIVGNVFKATRGDRVIILDINGNEFISGDLDTLKTCDSFILLKQSGDTWSILNTITGKRLTKKLYIYWDSDFKCVGEGLLGVKVDYTNYELYDIYLDSILNSVTMFKSYSKNGKCIINYKVNFHHFGYTGASSAMTQAVYNYNTMTFDKYGEYDLGKYSEHEYKAIATEKSDTNLSKYGCAETIFRYKLTKNDNIRGQKTYENIYRTMESLPNTFFVTDYYKERHVEKIKHWAGTKDIEVKIREQLIGLIDTEGNELIPTISSKLQYIGADNFLLALNSNGYDTIYNLKYGILYDYETICDIVVHSTLPISIIRFKNGACGAIDNKGNIFDIRDIAKYLKCSYSKNNTSIIRVELDYKTAYITNKLVPITNMNAISKYKKEEFISMS